MYDSELGGKRYPNSVAGTPKSGAVPPNLSARILTSFNIQASRAHSLLNPPNMSRSEGILVRDLVGLTAEDVRLMG